MKAELAYLISGKEDTGNVRSLDKQILSEMKGKNVAVLNFAADFVPSIKSWEDYFRKQFKSYELGKLSFISTQTSTRDSHRAFDDANLVYIAGGDAISIASNMRKKGTDLTEALEEFQGIIVGNSGGAVVLGEDYLKIDRIPTCIHPMFGIVPVTLSMHYERDDEDAESELRELSKERQIYALEDGAALVMARGGINAGTIGAVHWFYGGQNARVHPGGVI